MNCALYEKDNDDEKKRLEELKITSDEEKRGIELQKKDLQARQEKVAQNESAVIWKKQDLDKKIEEFKNSQKAQLEKEQL